MWAIRSNRTGLDAPGHVALGEPDRHFMSRASGCDGRGDPTSGIARGLTARTFVRYRGTMIRGIADPILSRAIENYVDGELHKLLNQAVCHWPSGSNG